MFCYFMLYWYLSFFVAEHWRSWVAFGTAIFWEFVQNVPLIAALVAGVWWWAKRQRAKALAVMVIGSTVGSLLIRFTEPIIHSYVEPVWVTFVNIVMMSLLMLPFAAYLGSEGRWSHWRMDLALGGGAGILLGLAQGLATPGAPVIGVAIHCLSFALAFPLALIGIRLLKGRSLSVALANSVLITAVVTLVIGFVDYAYFLL